VCDGRDRLARSADTRGRCPFWEATGNSVWSSARNNCRYMHLTLVPIVGGSGEIKTKPTAASVKECAASDTASKFSCAGASTPLPESSGARSRCSPTSKKRAVISVIDVDDIYKIPLLYREQALDDIVVDSCALEVPPTDLAEWRQAR